MMISRFIGSGAGLGFRVSGSRASRAVVRPGPAIVVKHLHANGHEEASGWTRAHGVQAHEGDSRVFARTCVTPIA